MAHPHPPERSWKKRAHSSPLKPSRDFANYFRGPSLWANPGLWRAYLEWRKMEQDEEFARFEAFILKNRELARKQMEEWPNPFTEGKRGEEYMCEACLPDCVPYYLFQGLAELGLKVSYDRENFRNCKISGIPRADGEFSIKLVYGWPGHRKGLPALQRELILKIGRNPQELWRDIPSREDMEYYQPDLEADMRSCEGRTLIAASRRGRAHAHVGLPRDDAFALDRVRGWSIMAVADGAGSAPYSRAGAVMACNIAVKTCHKKLAEESSLDTLFLSISTADGILPLLSEAQDIACGIVSGALFEVYKAIREEAMKKRRDLAQYASTLLLALCKQIPSGWIVMTIQIGDGAIAMVYDGQAWELPGMPDEGEREAAASFITMKDILGAQSLKRRLRIRLVKKLDSLLLMTNGFLDAKFAMPETLLDPDIVKNLWEEIIPVLNAEDAPAALLDWLQFPAEDKNDDRTIAAMF